MVSIGGIYFDEPRRDSEKPVIRFVPKAADMIPSGVHIDDHLHRSIPAGFS